MPPSTHVVVGLGLLVASPALAEVSYEGREFVTATTAACSTPNETVERVGDTANLVYHPMVPAGQTGPESIAILSDTRAQFLQPAGGGMLNASGRYKAVKIDAVGQLVPYAGNYRLSITQVSQDIVTISGVIGGAWDVPGCDVSFESVLGLRPALLP